MPLSRVSLVCFWLFADVLLNSSQANDQDHTLAIVLRPEFEREGITKTAVENIIAETKKKYMNIGAFNVIFYGSTDLNYEDASTVFSLASCDDTWKIFSRVNDEAILFMAITGPNCPRFPDSRGVTGPLTDDETELSQIILDLRSAEAAQHKSFHFLYDASIGDDVVNMIIKVTTLSLPPNGLKGTISLHRIDNYTIKGLETSMAGIGGISSDRRSILVMTRSTNIGIVLERGGREARDALSRLQTLHYLPVDYWTGYHTGSELHLDPHRKPPMPWIFNRARFLQLTDPTSKWLFMMEDAEDVPRLSTLYKSFGEGENVAFLTRNTTTLPDCHKGAFRLLEEMLISFAKALEKRSEEESILSKKVSPEEWEDIKPTKRENMDSLLHFIKAMQNEANCRSWNLDTVVSWGREWSSGGHDHGIVPVGSWSSLLGLQLEDFLFPHVRQGFRRRQLPLATFHNPPWQTVTYNATGDSFTYGGLVFEIVNELAKGLNFTYSVINLTNSSANNESIPEKERQNYYSESFGKLNANGSAEDTAWKVALDLLHKKKVFLAAIAFTETEERKMLVNFTTPVAVEPYSFMVSRPKELSRALLFLLPFAIDTWVCIVCVILMVAPLLNLVHNVSPFYDHYHNRGREGFAKMMNCFWYIYGALLQQGGAALPAADSGRLVVATWWLAVVVMATSYSGNLVAFLTFPKMETKVSNLDQLLDRRDEYTWGMPNTSNLQTLLQKANTARLIQIAKRAELHGQLKPQILDRIRYGNHVYFETKTKLVFAMKRDFLDTGSCDFSLGKEDFLEEHLGIIMLPGNPYFKMINKEIDRMHKMGLISKWMKDHMPKKGKCWNPKPSAANGVDNHTVNLKDMQGSFFVLIFGVMIGTFLAFGECLLKKWKNSKERGVIKPFVV